MSAEVSAGVGLTQTARPSISILCQPGTASSEAALKVSTSAARPAINVILRYIRPPLLSLDSLIDGIGQFDDLIHRHRLSSYLKNAIGRGPRQHAFVRSRT